MGVEADFGSCALRCVQKSSSLTVAEGRLQPLFLASRRSYRKPSDFGYGLARLGTRRIELIGLIGLLERDTGRLGSAWYCGHIHFYSQSPIALANKRIATVVALSEKNRNRPVWIPIIPPAGKCFARRGAV